MSASESRKGAAPRGGGMVLQLVHLVVALLAAMAVPSEACAMARCKRCESLPANVGGGVWRICVEAKRGYAVAANRRSVPFCANGFAAKRKGSACKKCKAGSVAPQGLIGNTTCTSCNNATTDPTLSQSKCKARDGYFGNGQICPVDFYCVGGVAIACKNGLTTNDTEGATSCDFVPAGQFFSDGVATPCGANTYAPVARTTSSASKCEACGTGLSTGGSGGALACNTLLKGYYRQGGSGTANDTSGTPVPCPTNSFQPIEGALATAPTSCTPCVNGTNTNAQTAQSNCSWLEPGFSAAPTVTPCAQNTFRSGTVLVSTAPSCTACANGFSTNGATAQATCAWINAGFYNNGSSASPVAAPCVPNTFSAASRPVAGATSCTPCVTGYSTGNSTGALSCPLIAAGYYVDVNSTVPAAPIACPVDFFTPLARTPANAVNCSLCTVGLSTNNATGAASCGFVQPGYFYNATSQAGVKCSSSSFASGYRPVASAANCTICPSGTLTGFRGASNASQCSLMAAGYFNAGNDTNTKITPCPAETFSKQRNVTDLSNCTACDEGFSTNKTTANTLCAFVAPGYVYDTAINDTRACRADTIAVGVRTIKQATTNCTACPTGLSTNGTTGASSCPLLAAGYYYNVTSKKPVPCPLNTYMDHARSLVGANTTTVGSCTACPGGLSTAKTTSTSRSACSYVRAGYYYAAPSVQPCPTNTFAGSQRPVAQAGDCTDCPSGGGTSGKTGQLTCSLVGAGYYYDTRTKATLPCPANKFFPTTRNITAAAAGCNSCPTGLTTNKLTAQATCTFVLPGYGYDEKTKAGVLCPLERYANGTRLVTDPSNDCTPCPTGLSTDGTGSTSPAECQFIRAGWYNAGASNDTDLQPCPVGSFFPTVRALSNTGNCTACADNLNTNGKAGQPTCNYVDPGYYYDAADTMGKPCPAGTAAAGNRVLSSAESCPKCASGLGTNATGSVSCDIVGPGYYWDGNATARPCEPESFANETRPITSPEALNCTQCPDNLSTNKTGATAEAQCKFVSAGYYNGGTAGTPSILPCPVNTYYPTGRNLSDTSACLACRNGSSTDGLTGQKSCGSMLPGYYYDLFKQVPVRCPGDTYANETRPAELATNCTACPAGTTTNITAATNEAQCQYIRTGYYNAGSAATPDLQPCPADTFSDTVRVLSDTSACTPCTAGSTGGQTGQVACNQVGAGYYFNTTLNVTLECPVDTFSAAARDVGSPMAASCSKCTPGLLTNGTTKQTDCLYVDKGYFFGSAGATPCDINKYSPIVRLKATAAACADCPTGTSTLGSIGQSGCVVGRIAGSSLTAASMRGGPAAAQEAPAALAPLTAAVQVAPAGPEARADDITFVPNTTAAPNDTTAHPANDTGAANDTAAGGAAAGDGNATAANATVDSTANGTAGGDGAGGNFTGNSTDAGAASNSTDANGTKGGGLPRRFPPATVPVGHYLTGDGDGVIVECPIDTHAPVSRRVRRQADRAKAASCKDCKEGLTTNGLTGQARCRFVKPGYYFKGRAAQPCPVDTFSSDLRAASTADMCSPCPGGSTTQGLTAQAACSP